MKEWGMKEEREWFAMMDKAAGMCLENIKESYTYEDLLQAFEGGAEWQRTQMPLPEDTLIFRKGVEEGRRLEREDVLSLIESRLSQIMGDAQPKPILRAELYDLLVQVKSGCTMTKDEAIYKVLHQRADCLLRLRAERPQDWKGYYEGKFDGYTQAMQLLTETLGSICIELE